MPARVSSYRSSDEKIKCLDDVAVQILVPKHPQIWGVTSQIINSDVHKHWGWDVPAPLSTRVQIPDWMKIRFVIFNSPAVGPQAEPAFWNMPEVSSKHQLGLSLCLPLRLEGCPQLPPHAQHGN